MADKILIVDDDDDLRSELASFLDGYEVVEARNGEEALKILKRANEIGLVILDVLMPGINGLDVLAEIKKDNPALKTVILTGHSSKDTAIEALKSRADDYIEKPIFVDKIKEIVEKFMEKGGGADLNPLDLKAKIEKVKRFVERNCYKKTTLQEAAKSIYLSPKYLSRIFKQEAGMGFSEYKLSIKIAKARELLVKTALNVNQISDRLGYENAESFIRQFKKFTKQTPTEYRKKTRGKKTRGKPRLKYGRKR
ncbi:MAG: response regulator [Candidatus Omnitrophota bacterium]|nr:response regulator [Candidatus Omnitrophota bacterium]